MILDLVGTELDLRKITHVIPAWNVNSEAMSM